MQSTKMTKKLLAASVGLALAVVFSAPVQAHGYRHYGGYHSGSAFRYHGNYVGYRHYGNYARYNDSGYRHYGSYARYNDSGYRYHGRGCSTCAVKTVRYTPTCNTCSYNYNTCNTCNTCSTCSYGCNTCGNGYSYGGYYY